MGDQGRTTYRGSKILMRQFVTIEVGETYRIAQICATSESWLVADSFCEGDSVMVKFTIPKGCWNAASIAEFSSIPSEKEVLLPPYTAIKITSKSKYNKLIECVVWIIKTHLETPGPGCCELFRCT